MQALTALVELFRYFVSWAPYPQKVLTTEKAVKFRSVSWFLVTRKEWWTMFRWGWTSLVPEPEVLPPGFYWYVPAITVVMVFVTVDDPYQIPPRAAATKDGHTVTVRGILTCRVSGPKKAATKCEGLLDTIQGEGIRANRKLAIRYDLADLAQDLSDELLEIVGPVLQEKYGVNVTAASFEAAKASNRFHSGLDQGSFVLDE